MQRLLVHIETEPLDIVPSNAEVECEKLIRVCVEQNVPVETFGQLAT